MSSHLAEDETRQAIDVARIHGTRVAAEWVGITANAMGDLRHRYDSAFTRGRGAPTLAEREAAKPNPWCPCPRCVNYYRVKKIKQRQERERCEELRAEALDWMDRANCGGMDPALFFPERGERTGPVKAICRGCMVRGECLSFALAEGMRFGVWGGTSERERKKIRREVAS